MSRFNFKPLGAFLRQEIHPAELAVIVDETIIRVVECWSLSDHPVGYEDFDQIWHLHRLRNALLLAEGITLFQPKPETPPPSM